MINCKALNFITLFILIIFTSCGTSKVKNHLYEDGLKGKVKSVKETSYLAEEKAGEIIKEEKVREQFDKLWSLYFQNKMSVYDTLDYYKQYNENGWITKKESYYYNENIYESLINNFNEKEQITESIISDPTGNLKEKIIYRYDKKGNLIEKEKFNDKGISISMTTFSNNNNKSDIEQNITDNFKGVLKDDITATNTYDADGNLQMELTQKYDARGNIAEGSFTDSKNDLYYKWINKFDEKNNFVEANIFGKNDILLSSRKFKYEFDETNNWIKRIVFIDNEARYIIEREILYY